MWLAGVLYFSLVSTSGMCSAAQNLTGFLSFRSGNKQWKAIQRDVASISKARVLLLPYKQPPCVVRRYTN
jgi:hypothetical protein